jgi:hypothetical protein
MNTSPAVPVDVRWYTPEEGGRQSGPPHGPTYAATGRFADQPAEEMFSVILHIAGPPLANGPDRVKGMLSPAFPENVPDFTERFQRGGERFILHEGRRAVAECLPSVPTPTTSGS